MTESAPAYWDSCLFITFLMNDDAAKVAILKELIERAKRRAAETKRPQIVMSNLVLAEVRPFSQHDRDHRKAIEELLEADRRYVQFFGLTRSIALSAADLGMTHPELTVPDLVHVATAIAAGAEVLLTYDGDRDKRRNRSGSLLRHHNKIGTPPLRIEVPKPEPLGPLFATVESGP
jgi:predicted nucleic acid-binding protein